MGATSEQISQQTNDIQNAIPDIKNQQTSIERLADYQHDMYMAVKYVNNGLVFFYLFLFTLIHVLFLEQYLRGIERSEFWDTVWLTVFFLYPYFIYFIEQMIYFGITYLASFIYGQTYVYQFDQIVTNTNFYDSP
jgi:hypothetical protein